MNLRKMFKTKCSRRMHVPACLHLRVKKLRKAEQSESWGIDASENVALCTSLALLRGSRKACKTRSRSGLRAVSFQDRTIGTTAYVDPPKLVLSLCLPIFNSLACLRTFNGSTSKSWFSSGARNTLPCSTLFAFANGGVILA